MSNQERDELLVAIAELCRRYPNWRLGQLVANVAGWADQEIWEIDDDQMLAAARTLAATDVVGSIYHVTKVGFDRKVELLSCARAAR